MRSCCESDIGVRVVDDLWQFTGLINKLVFCGESRQVVPSNGGRPLFDSETVVATCRSQQRGRPLLGLKSFQWQQPREETSKKEREHGVHAATWLCWRGQKAFCFSRPKGTFSAWQSPSGYRGVPDDMSWACGKGVPLDFIVRLGGVLLSPTGECAGVLG